MASLRDASPSTAFSKIHKHGIDPKRQRPPQAKRPPCGLRRPGFATLQFPQPSIRAPYNFACEVWTLFYRLRAK